MFFSRVTECKLPLGARCTVCRGKLNSQTVITEQTSSMKVQYYHWIFAWSGGAVTCFSWNPVFLCQWWQRNWTVFKHVLQSIRGKCQGPAGMNQGDVPHAHRGHFPLTGFPFVHKLQNTWNDSCQPGCSLSLIRRPGCGVVSTQARLCRLPLTGKLHTAPPLLIWGSPKGHQCVSSRGGFPLLKHKAGGSGGQRRWRRPNETQAAAKLNSHYKDSSSYKEDRGLWRLCCSAAETLSFCQTGNPFIPARKIMFILLFPPLGIIPYEKVLQQFFLDDVSQGAALLTFRFLTTAINLFQIHPSSCPPLSSEPLIFTLSCPPRAGIYAWSHGDIWHSFIGRNMGVLETSYNLFFIGKKRWGVSSWRNIINVPDQ